MRTDSGLKDDNTLDDFLFDHTGVGDDLDRFGTGICCSFSAAT